MTIQRYGENGYYTQQVDLAQLKKALIDEAIAARLTEGKIKADEMSLYAEVLESAENAVRYAKDELNRHPEEPDREEDEE